MTHALVIRNMTRAEVDTLVDYAKGSFVLSHRDIRARMHLGPAPALVHERIFGVTTFELGR